METNHCSDCQHFIQHYGFFEGAFRRVYCGHCTNPRIRSRKPDAKSCQSFCIRTEDGDFPISKSYLTQKLLEYILNLDTYPETPHND